MIYRNEHFSMDTNAYRLECAGITCALEPQVFDLIVYLIENRERVVTRQQLLDNLWQGRIVSDSAINARIKLARRALGDSGKQQRCIKTIHRRGYQFIAEIETPPTVANVAATGIDSLVPLSRQPSIAVLSFSNLSRDPNQAYFSEGMAHNICARLSRIRSLLVKPGFSHDTIQAAGAKLAAKLDVAYLLSGSVQRDGERVRVSVELIDGETGTIKWSEQFDRSGDAIIDIQDDIASAITCMLWSYSGTILEAEHERLASKPTRDFNAFDYILRGIHYKEKYTREDSLRAHQCYDHAIELDPRSAEALGWSGWQHIMDAVMSWSNDATTSLRLAYAAARAAIANDPHNEMGHWALAEALILDGDYERGYRAYDRAMEINPSNPDLLATRGIHEAISGRLDLGIGMIQQAIERNGLRPDWYFWNLGIAFFVANRLNEAITALECMRAHNTDSLAYLVACLAHGGRLDDARKRLAEWYHLEADFNLDALAEAHAYLGEAACKSFLDGLQLVLQSAQPQLHSVLR